MPKPEVVKAVLDRVQNLKFEPVKSSYTERDVMLYALSVGEGAREGPSERVLSYTYENAANFQVIPTMGVLFPFAVLDQMIGAFGGDFNPMMLLHGEQYIELPGPLPTSADCNTTAKIAGIYDKGKGALIVVEAETTDVSTGKVLCTNQISSFCRGLGGAGGPRNAPSDALLAGRPKREADATATEQTTKNQALLYRLMGDRNPLHADPNLAAMGGFDQPILHGLCTFGFAGRAVLEHFCGDDVSKVKSIRGRFTRHVFPGDTIQTQMWKEGSKVFFESKVVERPDQNALIGVVELREIQSKL